MLPLRRFPRETTLESKNPIVRSTRVPRRVRLIRDRSILESIFRIGIPSFADIAPFRPVGDRTLNSLVSGDD